jgi:hypothetical protein
VAALVNDATVASVLIAVLVVLIGIVVARLIWKS